MLSLVREITDRQDANQSEIWVNNKTRGKNEPLQLQPAKLLGNCDFDYIGVYFIMLVEGILWHVDNLAKYS